MRTAIFILLAFLFVACEKDNPVEPATHPMLDGHWTTSVHGYNLNALFAQSNNAVTGSGILTLDEPYSSNPVSISGVCLFPTVSLSIHSSNGSVANVWGTFLNDSTVFATIRGYTDIPMPITLNRQLQ